MGTESGFLTAEPTLADSTLRRLSFVGGVYQVHPGGATHSTRKCEPVEHAGIHKMECASTNESQICVSLVGGELIPFEVHEVKVVCCASTGNEIYGKHVHVFCVCMIRFFNADSLYTLPL